MKRFGLTIAFVWILGIVLAQQQIRGSVTDPQGTPVPGANIYLLNTYDGVSSDITGEFKFSTDVKGLQVIVASMVGYKENRIPVNLDTLNNSLSVTLKEEIKRLDDLVITAGAFEASDEKKSVLLKPIDIVTTAGATADIAGVMNTMPGMQKVGEKGRLFVRGGEDSETKNYIDGVLVDNIYNISPENIPSRMRFSPFLFSGTLFSTGGYSAEYGQALSGTLVLKTDDTPVQSQTDLSLMTVGGSLARTQKWNRGSLFGETYYINVKPYFAVVPQNRHWERAPSSWQNTFMLRQEVGKNGRLKVFYSNEFSGMSIEQPSMLNVNNKINTSLGNDYHYLNINYTTYTDKNWCFYYGLSETFSSDTVSMDILSEKRRQHSVHTKLMAHYDPGNRFGIRFGTDQYFTSYQENLYWSPAGFHFLNSFNDWIPALFAESDIYFSQKLIGRLGAREEYSSLSSGFIFSPRLSLAYKTGRYSLVSFAAGKFNQRPQPESLVINGSLRDENASHYILNYQVTKNDRTFRIEAYRKTYAALVKYDTLNSYDPAQYNNAGFGYANGLDFFWRDSRTIRNGDYWISYSLIDTKRLYKNYPVETMPAFVSRHNLSIVYKQFFSKLHSQLGMTYTFSSGRPYNDPNADKFNSGITPAYHDLSVNWSYLIKPYIILHFSATNIFGRDNIFSYQYSLVPDERGTYESIPVKQGARRFLFMGLFITLTKDNKANQIRNL